MLLFETGEKQVSALLTSLLFCAWHVFQAAENTFATVFGAKAALPSASGTVSASAPREDPIRKTRGL
jgi:hypothetical protein